MAKFGKMVDGRRQPKAVATRSARKLHGAPDGAEFGFLVTNATLKAMQIETGVMLLERCHDRLEPPRRRQMLGIPARVLIHPDLAVSGLFGCSRSL